MHNPHSTHCYIHVKNGETLLLFMVYTHTYCPVSNEDWVNTQKLLSTTLKRAAKVALGKDATKVQKYVMSGNVHRALLAKHSS